MRGNWSKPQKQLADAPFTALHEHLAKLAKWISDRAISGRVAYDLLKAASAYDNWQTTPPPEMIVKDTLSILAGKRPSGQSQMAEVKKLIQESVLGADDLRRLSAELLAAHQLAVAMRQAAGNREVGDQ